MCRDSIVQDGWFACRTVSTVSRLRGVVRNGRSGSRARLKAKAQGRVLLRDPMDEAQASRLQKRCSDLEAALVASGSGDEAAARRAFAAAHYEQLKQLEANCLAKLEGLAEVTRRAERAERENARLRADADAARRALETRAAEASASEALQEGGRRAAEEAAKLRVELDGALRQLEEARAQRDEAKRAALVSRDAALARGAELDACAAGLRRARAAARALRAELHAVRAAASDTIGAVVARASADVSDTVRAYAEALAANGAVSAVRRDRQWQAALDGARAHGAQLERALAEANGRLHDAVTAAAAAEAIVAEAGHRGAEAARARDTLRAAEAAREAAEAALRVAVADQASSAAAADAARSERQQALLARDAALADARAARAELERSRSAEAQAAIALRAEAAARRDAQAAASAARASNEGALEAGRAASEAAAALRDERAALRALRAALVDADFELGGAVRGAREAAAHARLHAARADSAEEAARAVTQAVREAEGKVEAAVAARREAESEASSARAAASRAAAAERGAAAAEARGRRERSCEFRALILSLGDAEDELHAALGGLAEAGERVARERRAREQAEAAATLSKGRVEAEAGGALEQLEASLIRMSDILRRKEAELALLQRTVHSECAERLRLLELLASLGVPASAGAPPIAAPGGGAVRAASGAHPTLARALPAAPNAAPAGAPSDIYADGAAAWSGGLALARAGQGHGGAQTGGRRGSAAVAAQQQARRALAR